MDGEVLVHVKASSRLSDDKRYAAIARNVLNFEPVSKINVISAGELDGLSDTSGATVENRLPKDHTNAALLAPYACSRSVIASADKRPQDLRKVLGVSKQSTSSNGIARTSNNPPYRSPIRGKVNGLVSEESKITTPFKATSPTTTKRCSGTLVPNTENRRVKRARLDLPFVDVEDIVITDSQPFPDTNLSFPSQFFHSDAISLSTASPQEQATSTPYSTLLLRTTARSHPTQRVDVDDEGLTAKPRGRLNSEDSGLGHGGEATQMIQDTTTATPSAQPLSNACYQVDTEEIENNKIQPSPVDLEPSHSILRWHQSTFSAIRELSVVINAPLQNGRYKWVSAQKIPILNAIAAGLGMPEDFKPETVNRAILDHERGYWKVPFTITTSDKVEALKNKNASGVQSGKYPMRQHLLSRHRTLTEDEFIEVWKDLDRLITSGSAGWGISVTRREFSVQRLSESSVTHAQLHLQVHCYGEDIPYVYAMLLKCTRMHVLCKPLQWISALSDRPVLVMTGEVSRREPLVRARPRFGQR